MDFETLYINGQWIPGSTGEFIDVEDPGLQDADRVRPGPGSNSGKYDRHYQTPSPSSV